MNPTLGVDSTSIFDSEEFFTTHQARQGALADKTAILPFKRPLALGLSNMTQGAAKFIRITVGKHLRQVLGYGRLAVEVVGDVEGNEFVGHDKYPAG